MANIINATGAVVGERNVPEIFQRDFSDKLAVIYRAVHREFANPRAGTASTLKRDEVSGGGRKPWRQKGTGKARAGSIRSPLWEGGGVIFGPKPREFSLDMPKKMRKRALACALSAKTEDFVVVDDIQKLKQGKTKEVAALLKSLGIAGNKILLVLDDDQAQNSKVAVAARNIRHLKVVRENDLSVKDLLDCKSVVFSKSAIEAVDKRLTAEATENPAAKAPAKRKSAKAEDKE